jgi:hypothetical protein
MLQPLLDFKKMYKFHSGEVLDIDFLSVKKLLVTHTYSSKAVTLVVLGELDLEVPSKSSKDYQITSTYHELRVKNLIITNDLKRIFLSL